MVYIHSCRKAPTTLIANISLIYLVRTIYWPIGPYAARDRVEMYHVTQQMDLSAMY
jgi:hypothetical protein